MTKTRKLSMLLISILSIAAIVYGYIDAKVEAQTQYVDIPYLMALYVLLFGLGGLVTNLFIAMTGLEAE